MRRLRIVSLVTLVMLLAAAPTSRPVLVVQESVGNRGTFPSIMLYADGRVVFIRDDTSRMFATDPGYFAVRVPPATRDSLLALFPPRALPDTNEYRDVSACRAGIYLDSLAVARGQVAYVRGGGSTTLAIRVGRGYRTLTFAGGIPRPGEPSHGRCVPPQLQAGYDRLIAFDRPAAQAVASDSSWQFGGWWER
jgi:hypothetical protein